MWATPTILGRVGAADNAPLAPVCATHVETKKKGKSVCKIFIARDGGLPCAQLSSSSGKGSTSRRRIRAFGLDPQGLKPSLILRDCRGAKAPLFHSAKVPSFAKATKHGPATPRLLCMMSS